jgi:hypothetical protein
MNILPLVFGFLLLFTFLSSTLIKHAFFFSSEKQSVESYLSSKLALKNKWERYKYDKFKTAGAEKEEKSKKERMVNNQAKYHSHRTRESLPPLAKWNLAALVLNESPIPFLHQSAAALLKDLYGHTEFWIEGESKNPLLAEELLFSFRMKDDKKEMESLSDLFPLDPLLQPIFYKLLKGSNSYNLKKKEGYPPLEDFFSFEPKNKKTLCLCYASYPALKAFLGEDLAQEIVSLEKKKWGKTKKGYPTITEKELVDLVSFKGPDISLSELQSQTYFVHKFAPIDKLTQKNSKGAFIHLTIPQKNTKKESTEPEIPKPSPP